MNTQKINKMLFQEPAKFFGWVIASVITLSAILVAILNNIVDVLPENWKGKVNASITTIVLVGIIASRIQAVLTRSNVYSPATVANDPSMLALKGTQPGTTPQGGPQNETDGSVALEELRSQLGIKQ